ncbi:MAG: phospholipid carrier-dependent glycosyltransferase [Micrococcales bacterium]|nr:phospholipid carrier-dependent glycosyltransferase [Micrococcales bacterium]
MSEARQGQERRELVPGVPLPDPRPRHPATEPRGTRLDAWWAAARTDPALDRAWRWGGPALVLLVAAILRLQNLGTPGTLVFDETYYVKDAWTLAHLGYEGSWGAGADQAFASGNPDVYSAAPSFIAHPPLGKWLIALGELATGGGNPVGWRISTAIIGILLVGVTMLLVRILLRGTLLPVLAGGLLAIDGNAIVMSRVALLDNSLALFALLGALCVLRDRGAARRRLEAWVIARELAHRPTDWGPLLLWRPWLLLAGLAFGAATGVKWNGLYFLAVFAVFVVVSDMLARRRAGCGFWFSGTLLRQAPATFVLMVPLAALTYLATWTGWFLSSGGYDRNWIADGNPAWTGPLAWVPPALQNWWQYQTAIYGFNVGESSPHSYAANPLTWLFLVRPTVMYYQDLGDGTAAEITGLANPLIWWAAVAALGFAAYRFVRSRDAALGFILVGVAAGYLPWLLYLNRTVFQFYTIAFEPYLVLALAAALGYLLGTASDPRDRRRVGLISVGAFLAACVLLSVFFYPLWTGQAIPLWYLRLHYWLPTWI